MGIFSSSRKSTKNINNNFNTDNKQDNRVNNDIDNSIENDINNSTSDNALNFANSTGDINVNYSNSDDFNSLLSTTETLFSDLNNTQLEQVNMNNQALSNIATLKSGEKVEQVKNTDINPNKIAIYVGIIGGIFGIYKFIK
jgi:hypothetical protein